MVTINPMEKQQVTFLPARLGDLIEPVTRKTGYDLPAHLQEQACRRVAQFALMMTVLATLVLLVSRPVWQDHADHKDLLLVRIMQILTVLFSLGLFGLARSMRFRHPTILNIGLIYEVLLCFIVSLGYNWFTGSTYGVFAAMTIASVVIAVYPMIVPSPPRKTFIAALASAATAPLGIFIVARMGVAKASFPDYLGVSIYPAVCVMLAVFGSRVIYGLNRDVARAQKLGSYHLEKQIGKGGMGEVWQANHRLLARPAAVKLVRPDALVDHKSDTNLRMLQRFEREAQVTASLKSPHTVDLYDFGRTDDGNFYYVMELLDGIDLDTLINKYGSQPADRVVNILIQVCKSLAEAHEAKLVHRDIKPANISICRYGREFDFVKVLDFGLVALEPERNASDPKLTVEGLAGGTPAYMPPEMVEGKPVDGRADIYSLGCVAFWLLTGRLVFEGPTPMAVILAHIKETPEPPSRVAEVDIPANLDRIILACLEKDPDKRPQTADDLMAELAACPLETPWTPLRAEKWWAIHRPKISAQVKPATYSG